MQVIGAGLRILAGRWSDHVRARIAPLRQLASALAAALLGTAVLTGAPLALLLPALVVAGALSLSWNGLSFTAAAELAGRARSGAALGFQQTALSLSSDDGPVFAAVVDAGSWGSDSGSRPCSRSPERRSCAACSLAASLLRMSSVETVRARLATPSAQRALRYGGPIVYAVALGITLWVDGLPLSRDRLLMWILLGLLAFSLTNVRGWLRSVVLEWIPFPSSSGSTTCCAARRTASSSTPMCSRSSEWMSSSLVERRRQSASERLLERARPSLVRLLRVARLRELLPRHLHRGCVPVVGESAAVSPLRGDGLGARDHGFRDVCALPGGPPWMASDLRRPRADRRAPSASSGGTFRSRNFNTLFEKGTDYANPVAAVPSLHAAYTLLITLVFGDRAASWGRVLLALYPWAMLFALVYTAEHYAGDILSAGSTASSPISPSTGSRPVASAAKPSPRSLPDPRSR